MNIENIDRLIAHLEQVPDKLFDMRDWRQEKHCGTVACIGGHMEILFFDGRHTSHTTLAETLDVRYDQTVELFFPSEPCKDYGLITRQDAIRVLQNLKATGRVDWSIL